MGSREKRLLKELREVEKDKESGIVCRPIDESDNTHLLATFDGPADTPYEGGTFQVDVVVPDNYPFSPLKMKFITKVYHPNISSQTGAICLDILKNSWSPVYTLKTTLLSLQSLFCSPEPSDPQDAEVAKLYMADINAFNATAKYWTKIYAIPDSDSKAKKSTSAASKIKEVDPVKLAGLNQAHVDRYMGMGFEQKKVIEVLARLNYRGKNVDNVSEDQVVNALLG